MQSTPTIEVMTGSYGNGSGVDQTGASGDARQRWKLLLVVFVVCLVIGQAWVWLRAPVYRSFALLHLSYSQPGREELSSIATEHLDIHRQRLTSPRLTGLLAERLARDRQIDLSTEQLSKMLGVNSTPDSRLLKLSATDTDRTILQPVVQSWITVYEELLSGSREDAATQELLDLRGKLSALEERVAARQAEIANYTSEHSIISLERDESSLLNQLKGLSSALDTATEEKAAAMGQLRALEAASRNGEIMVRPQDQRSLDNMEDRALALEEQLFQLSQQYTPEYMALDPNIVGLKNNLESLRSKTAARRAESHQTYVSETRQTVEAASLRETDIRRQLHELEARAQEFSHKLSEYASLNQDLEQLRTQAQLVRDQIIDAEVGKPFQARVNVLEAPVSPEFPVGPDYRRDAWITLLAAFGIALVSVGIYALINRQHRPGMILSPYAVITNPPKPAGPTPQLAGERPQAISYRQASELDADTCSKLLDCAPPQCKLALSLMLGGVNSDELLRLEADNFDLDSAQLSVPGQHRRRLRLPAVALETFLQVRGDQDADRSLWSAPGGEKLELPNLERMLETAATRAAVQSAEPTTLDDLRFTYLMFLARQGAPLSDIEAVAGFLSVRQMEHCQRQTASAPPSPSKSLETIHPALV